MIKKTKKTITTPKSVRKPVDVLFTNIRQLIDEAREKTYRATNIEMIKTYWEAGRMIFEEEQQGKARADYGSYLLKELSKKLTLQYGKGFDITNLKLMRSFYKTFTIGDAVRHQLSWTHYRLLLRVERQDARDFYLEESKKSNWNTRALERQINSLYFERLILTDKKKRKSVKKEAEKKTEKYQAQEIIKDPYVLDFLNIKNKNPLYERELEQGLIDKLQEFLLELGKGFSFVGRQYLISTEEGKHFHVDLVFYNFILKCFLLIDLKTQELSHQDIGQMDFYVRYFEDQVKVQGDNPTIGLILCTEKDKTIVKYSMLNNSKQIFASKYKLYLPNEKILKKEMDKERQHLELEMNLKNER
ncbi:MAG: PDDEXK nuclease domain-containing protein [Flavobacteriales bacterium]